MAPLFKGQPPLISVLDGAKDGGSNDGYVSRGDMKRFMEDYDRFTNGGKMKAPDGSPYTAENAKYVQELLDGKHASIPDSGDGFNVQQLADAGGFDNSKGISNPSDYGDVVKGFNALQPADTQQADKTAKTGGDQKTEAPKAGTTTDANGSQITTDDKGNVTDVKYKDGKSRHFDYGADGKLSGLTQEGHQYVTKDGGKSFESTYQPKAGETPDRTLYNVQVDKDGTFHATVKDHDKMVNVKVGTDDKPVLDAKTAQSTDGQSQSQSTDQTATTSADAQKQIVDDGTAKAGEGYIKVAARLLGKPGANDTDPDVRALYQELEALNQNKKLHVGEQVVTPEMIAKIQNPAFKARMQGLDKSKQTAQTQTDGGDDDTQSDTGLIST